MPSLDFGSINYTDFLSKEWRESLREIVKDGGANPFIVPEKFQRCIEAFHAMRNYAWSYGGYLERRDELWKGSYLDKLGGAVLHAGIDVNLPQGTPLIAIKDFRVLVVDDDHCVDGGWGPRLILEPLLPGKVSEDVVVYAHLQNVEVKKGDIIAAGQKMGEIGGAPHNGNWWPHLHVQAVDFAWLISLAQNGSLAELDGYFLEREQGIWLRRYKDPIEFMPLKWDLP